MGRLPWRALAAIAQDPAAHPQARIQAVEKLQYLWQGLTMGERRSLAPLAPGQIWHLIWRVRDEGVITALLCHPRLSMEALVTLIQPPLLPVHFEALSTSRWLGAEPVSMQVLLVLDAALAEGQEGLALGHGAPWIKALAPESRLVMASRLIHPPLRRACRTWAVPSAPEEY
jgi:hypothetical protein